MEESIPGGGTGYQYSPMAFRSVSSTSHELSRPNREASLTANPSFILDTARNALVPQAMPDLGGMRMGYHRGAPVPPAYRQRGRSRSVSRGRDNSDRRRRQPSMDKEIAASVKRVPAPRVGTAQGVRPVATSRSGARAGGTDAGTTSLSDGCAYHIPKVGGNMPCGARSRRGTIDDRP